MGARFNYNGRVRRSLRAGRRAAGAVVDPRRRPAVVVRTHWWEPIPNFGDLLTPLLLPEFGVFPIKADPAEADLVGIGSLVQHVPASSRAVFWGTGLIEDQPQDLPGVTTLALRGELTRDRMGNPPVEALGDPGLLLERLVRRTPARHDIGVVPHYAHLEDPEYLRLQRDSGAGIPVIDVKAPPKVVAAHIASCRTILTSSLHGLITADSLGIPAVWMPGSLELVGGEFKFRDHETVARPARERRRPMAELASWQEAAALAVAADETAIAVAKDRLAASAVHLTELGRAPAQHSRVSTNGMAVSGGRHQGGYPQGRG